ncbi:hypothetical protein Syun_010995 [Stephania yunnanensis]|uniref:Uncharacterized protein n=1 Tax=Stephania yunnanensis TaxID=152371 RepID=A0AAP0PHT6_9MAGN
MFHHFSSTNMATTTVTFTAEEMEIDQGLGYPKAYPKLCRDIILYPFTFLPFPLPPPEALRARELDQIFPILNPEAKPSARPKIYANLLWKQLNHLGNAGFDPEKFRVDPYGNVLYYRADSASPLAWEIDHWFPCSRGGKTVASNLRILQWQVCKRKHNQLEFLVPWWDLQLGVSVNQFLSVFASSNSDFRNRAFSLLFADGENEELNSSQTVESHAFPQHFHETKQKVGLAAAAIVLNRRESSDPSSVLRSIDVNRRLRPSSPSHGSKILGEDCRHLDKSIRAYRPLISKENDNPCDDSNPHLAIALARDSLRQKDEIQGEIQKLDEELNELTQRNDKERVALQDLELVLIKRRRRAEKCRRLAEAQSSYRSLLEKMIRDAMHQSVIYKEQVRLNQAATTALMARLEAQAAICDSSEKDVHRKFKQREEVEQQIRSCSEQQARKRSRMDGTQVEERDERLVLCLPGIQPRKPLQKELRAFLEEEHKASEEAARCLIEGRKLEEIEEEKMDDDSNRLIVTKTFEEGNSSRSLAVDEEQQIEDKLGRLDIGEGSKISSYIDSAIFQSPEREEDEECRKQRGKGNVEKWLQMLLDDTNEDYSSMGLQHQQDTLHNERSRVDDDVIEQMNNVENPTEEIRILKFPALEEKADSKPAHKKFDKEENRNGRLAVEMDGSKNLCENTKTSEVMVMNALGKGVGGSSKRFERKERRGELVRCESARTFRPAPYSPSLILGMKKGVDCIGKKPNVTGSDEDIGDEVREARNRFFKSPFRTFKKSVKT